VELWYLFVAGHPATHLYVAVQEGGLGGPTQAHRPHSDRTHDRRSTLSRRAHSAASEADLATVRLVAQPTASKGCLIL
jgi:hypothetical protein